MSEKSVKVHKTQLRERIINNSKAKSKWSTNFGTREVLKGPCVTVTEEEWNSSLEKINIKKGVMKWIVHWK